LGELDEQAVREVFGADPGRSKVFSSLAASCMVDRGRLASRARSESVEVR